MSHAFHLYLAGTLDKMLREDRVVVFYDPRTEFLDFIDELAVVGTGRGDLPRVLIQDTLTHLARYDGSYFALKAAVEPIMELEQPEPLLVYLPGAQRDQKGSVLMELELGGKTYEPQLKRLARNELRRRYTDGDIDEMLATENLTYQDVARFLTQEGGGGVVSMLKVLFDNDANDRILTRWLASASKDEAIESKGALPELYKLVQARLGLRLEAETPLEKARHQTRRYLLVGEFRADLTCCAPAALAIVPEPTTEEERKRGRDIVETLRVSHGVEYIAMADVIERELELAKLDIDPAHLGSVDTFRFEEQTLLGHAAHLIISGNYDEALKVVVERGRSFWVDRDVGRLAQWEGCRLMAELGQQITRVKPSVKKANGKAAAWVAAYTAEKGGWYEVDLAQRALEAWLAKMDTEPEAMCEKALTVVRRAYENLLRAMAEGFSEALSAGDWSMQGVLHQTHVYPEVVEHAGGRVAYFFVDAMRYEMGADLRQQLRDAEDVRLQAAIAALPSITPLGMAALLPGASSSFSVVEHNGNLAARIGDRVMSSSQERMKYLKSRQPGARDIDLGTLLQKPTDALAKQLDGVPLVIVRSQAIDGLGEMDGGLLARHIMDTVVGNVARAVRKLANIGIDRFVITSDHGHQFSLRKGADMTMDKPGGDTVDQHRRCWAGRGGQTSGACLRVSGAELGYDTDLDFIFPRGIAIFKTGGDPAYHHGGISLQEVVVPVLSLRLSRPATEQPMKSPVQIEGFPEVITNRTFGMRVRVDTNIFDDAPVTLRLVLISDGQEVGQAGMALDAELDRATGQVHIEPGGTANIAMMLTRDDCKKLRIVAQDPTTDAVLAQSNDIQVKLGI
jgi:hypothetical protein